MFDLNLSTDFNGHGNFEANNSEGLSPETSVENGEGESSSSNDHTCSVRASASNGGNDRIEEDDPNQGSGLVTRELFPVSRLDEPNRQNEPALIQPRMAVQQELQQVQQVQAKKSRRGPRSRSSQYRGVTFYRRTGRWESHIWDCGKQVYLGGFDTALAAARAYDRAAIRFRGVAADINFNLRDYDDMKEMMNLSKEEFVLNLRRQSNGFSRGSSRNRGAMPLQKCGHWEARTGQFLGNKVYDKAANGSDAVSNFEMSKYNGEMMSGACNNGALEMGSQHDLNLNLGMSASPSKESEFSGSLKLGHDFRDSRTLKLHVGNSGTNGVGNNRPLEGVPVTSKHPILCSGVNPKFVSNYEENAWQMHGHDRVTQTATAASSGFSSLATIPPVNCVTPVPTGLSLRSNVVENASGCYSWIKPHLPPS